MTVINERMARMVHEIIMDYADMMSYADLLIYMGHPDVHVRRIGPLKFALIPIDLKSQLENIDINNEDVLISLAMYNSTLGRPWSKIYTRIHRSEINGMEHIWIYMRTSRTGYPVHVGYREDTPAHIIYVGRAID